MGLFTKTDRSRQRLSPMAQKMASGLIARQRRLADYLNNRLGQMDPRIVLLIICSGVLLLAAYFAYLMLAPFLS